MTMVDPVTTPNEPEAMVAWLTTGGAGGSCLLLTARGIGFEIAPLVDAELMERAARTAGFARTTTLRLPDRRTVVVWRRLVTCPVTSDAGAGA
jgi:hypothetical protein